MTERQFMGEPGTFALSGGIPPVAGTGARIADFTPPVMLEPPTERWLGLHEADKGHAQLYGTPLSHAAQQLTAWFHAKQAIGFGNGPVTFTVHWNWLDSSEFTATMEGWVQG